MAQETNLNVAPYFDDFDANNDYYKVLFKPGYPVQARELTTLQSILQNQIEKFGQHFFKEGAKVIPGNTAYSTSYYAVELENTYLGVPISDYIGQILGSKITGLISGVTAVVNKIILSNESERGNTTLYISYLESNSQDNSSLQFLDGELLSVNKTITSSSTVIASGEAIASTLSANSTSVGSAFSISNGIYFAKGQFLNVNDETILLDQYSNKPSYRVGLLINEEIVNSDIDSSLNDNSRGFNNYAAPGADRLKVTTSLHKKSLDDFDDNNFIELATIDNGILRSQKKTTDYNILEDELARRTYSESGDYYVTPFDLTIKESLNNNLGNRGIFNSNQQTYGGQSPSEDLALYQISPGKAFVRGYEIETISSAFLDVPKPRTIKILENQSINYQTGSTLKLNRVYGSPQIGVGNTYVLSLRDTRVGIASTIAPGKEIGVARIYDFKLDSGSYNSTNLNINEWNISLYDIQTISEITINEPINLSVPTFIKGKYSGATAFLKSSVSSGVALTVYEKTGNFIQNEPFIFNGIENTRVATSITSYNISDVKSVFGTVGSSSTFSADTIQSSILNIGLSTISAVNSLGISTVTSTNSIFPRVLKVGNLLKFSNQSSIDPIFASVVSIATSHVTISGVTTVFGVCGGQLPQSTTLQVTDLELITTELQGSEDNSFYTELPKQNISSVDLTNATLTIRKSYVVNIINNQLSTTIIAGENETFLPFDSERYFLIRSDGIIESLSSDKISLTNGSTELQIYNLGSNNTGATLVTTLRKIKPKQKIKIKNRVNSIIVDKSKYISSGIGSTTLNDGLNYGNYAYGTRVQDENISLNVPDIIEIHSIYESVDTSTPSAPTVELSSITGPTGKTLDLVIGEKFIGQTSGAVAICAERITDSKISFISKNNINFKEGEIIVFEESNIQAFVTTLNTPSINVSFNFTYDNGQNSSFYDYGLINRKSGVKEPSRKLKIYFSNGYYQSSDDGDITTVDSYSGFDYTTEIQTVNSTRNSDIIDIRPRVSTYSVSEGSRSPLEFYGRTFTQSGNSSSNILASNESIITNFSFYLGRIDRIYLTKDGKFQIKYGTPAEKPEKPVSVDDCLEIASVSLPPYLYNISQASITFLEHKRYRMVDIKQLENRIRTLEYYTALSLLETNTSNLFIPDSSGLNRFKSGFFVDNFTSLLVQEENYTYKNSIDIKNKELRPQHYTDSIDLIVGPVENVDPNRDLSIADPEGINIKKTGDIVTLNYSETEWLKQTFATRSESVTPFLVSFWQGSIELTPASDTWVDTVRIEAKIINTEGNFAETLALASRTLNVDPQTGFSPTIWNAWETTWAGQEVVQNTRERSETTNSGGRWGARGLRGNGNLTGGEWITNTTTTVFKDTLREVRDTGVQTRTGTRTVVTEQFDNTSVGDRVVSRNLISFMRSRNVQFVAKKVKPSTQLYAFFDGVNVTNYCVPKLLEISMISGVFQVGETVVGTTRPTGSLQINSRTIDPRITFRVAQSNHKEGAYNSPTKLFTINPYDAQTIPSTYSSTSTVLNIDTFSLSNHTEGGFNGWVEPNMILIGQTSGAQAIISNVRLISDISATLIGSFYIPNPNSSSNPRFESGNKIFTLLNNNINDQNNATTIAEEGFTSSGTIETVQENIISVRNARIENKQEFEERATSRTTGTQVISTQAISSTTRTNTEIVWYDPLAQSFLVEDETGVFLTKCDVFFSSKDDLDIPVTFQLRTMSGGFPTQKVIPFSEIILDPSEVNVSADGSVPTTFTFKSPVYLEGGTEYAICLASLSTKYSVYISRVGENDLITQTFISNQPYLGSLFKSQNASTWEPSQWEDLKFTLYRAEFVPNGSIEFYNPELSDGNNEIASLLPNSLNLNSRKIRVGLGSTLQDNNLTFGNTVLQLGTNASGNYIGNAGISTGTLNIINSGIGYTPSLGTFQFNGVPLTNITGNGRNATANITISDGVAIAATISQSGTGYVIGDVLGIGTIGNNSLGRNARLSVVSIANTNELILDNVQGNFVISGVGNTIQYINNSGLTTTLNASSGGNVQISDINIDSDGLHILVNHKNHGMYFDRNYVTISNAQSDIIPTKLSVNYDSSSTSPIQVDSISNFGIFENVGVGTTNLGYILIGDEIISYSSVYGSTIGGNITRGVDSTLSKNYPAGTLVYKYELGGVSLRRINKTHNLENVTISDPITFDSYNIKLDMGSNGIGRSTGGSFPILYMGQTKSAGGYAIKATQNIPFEIITPLIQNVTVQGTSVNAEVRTVTGSSISGNEIPFLDQGFEIVSLNKSNYLNSPRIICSKINETNNLNNLPGNKSLNLRVNLNTVDSRVSPVIDTQRVSTILTSNRVNDAILDFVTDNRANTISNDPTAFQYLSKEIVLENPASSLKIIVNAHTNLYSNIRAFYSISPTENFTPIFVPFPGYNNIDQRGQVIDIANNDGLSDTYIPPSTSIGFLPSEIEYKEFTFTADQLPSFRSYRIKIIMTSTNQVYVPRMKDLRVVALA